MREAAKRRKKKRRVEKATSVQNSAYEYHAPPSAVKKVGPVVSTQAELDASTLTTAGAGSYIGSRSQNKPAKAHTMGGLIKQGFRMVEWDGK